MERGHGKTCVLNTVINRSFCYLNLILVHSVFIRVFPMELQMRRTEISGLVRRTGSSLGFFFTPQFAVFLGDVFDCCFIKPVNTIDKKAETFGFH